MAAASAKDNLMNSLMGGGGGGGGFDTNGDEDLFGNVPVVPEAAPSVTMMRHDFDASPPPPVPAVLSIPIPHNLHHPAEPPPVTTPLAPVPSTTTTTHAAITITTTTTTPAPSLLAASGLLGGLATNNPPPASVGGTNGGGGGTGGGLFDEIDQEEERKQQAEEEAAQQKIRAAAAAERKKRNEEEERQRQLQDQMQSIHLGSSPHGNNGSSTMMFAPPPGASIGGGGYGNAGGYNNTGGGGVPYIQQPSSSSMPQYRNAPAVNSFSPTNGGGAPMVAAYGAATTAGNPPMMTTMMQVPPTTSMMMQSPAQMQQSMQSSMMQQQQQQPGMQSSMMQQQQLGMQSSMMPQPQQQQQQQVGMQSSMMQPQPGMMMQSSYQYHNNGSMMQQQPQPPPSRYYQSPQRGSATAGMHGAGSGSGRQQQQQSRQYYYLNGGNNNMLPPHILQQPAVYDRVLITEPLLLNAAPAFLGLGQPPHWSYQISTTLQDGSLWTVRRRFRHVVALEDRLREACPGAILPPRPDKHATRAIEEASAHQSAEFALQRAAELQVYLNQLIHHPIACTSIVLRLFLALQDDLGTAWQECSNNALTRLANASVGAAVKVSESTANMQTDSSEDNAELLALQNYESSRIGAVLQAVPKLEGAVTLLREQAEEQLAVGMEFSRVAKEVAEAQPMDIASAGLLRSGRRSKRLGLEMSAALQSFSHHYKLCRYERMAFGDRRAAIARRHKERHRADQRASHMMHHQQFGLAQSAAMMDDMANDAGHECEEIGQRVKAEVHRVAQMRRAEWSASVKIVASAMKEALTERVAIWESVRENFFQTYPEFKPPAEPPVVDGPPQLHL